MSKTENVLCVPTGVLWPDAKQTQRPCFPQELEAIIEQHGVYLPRSPETESDESYQQICPYIVVTSGEHVLAYTRIKGGEKRLDGVLSVGFGGHINDGDRGANGPLFNGTDREHREEVDSDFEFWSWSDFEVNTHLFRFTSDAVGRVHTAFLLRNNMPSELGVHPTRENNVDPEMSNPHPAGTWDAKGWEKGFADAKAGTVNVTGTDDEDEETDVDDVDNEDDELETE